MSQLLRSQILQSRSLKDLQSAYGQEATLHSDAEGSHLTLWEGARTHTFSKLDDTIKGGLLYGGGEFCLGERILVACTKKDTLISVNLHTDRVTTLVSGMGRVSAPVISPNGQWVAFLYGDDDFEALGLVDVQGKYDPITLCHNSDFYTQPVWHPNSEWLAWMAWENPNMPWTESALHMLQLAPLNQSAPEQRKQSVALEVVRRLKVVSSPETAYQQPGFSPDGEMFSYLSDANGFMNLYLHPFNPNHLDREPDLNFANTHHDSSYDSSLLGSPTYFEMNAEIGTPVFVQGLRHYQWLPDSQHLVAIVNQDAKQVMHLCRVSTLETIPLPLKGVTSLSQISADSKWHYVTKFVNQDAQGAAKPLQETHDKAARISVIGSGPKVAPQGYVLTCSGLASPTPEVESRLLLAQVLSPGLLETLVAPQHAEWQTFHGPLYAVTYVPHTLSKALPAAVIMIHGGPTDQSLVAWDLKAQYFASKGCVVMQLNYRGSTGYGRVYMNAMNHQWGISDVEDVMAAKAYLVDTCGVNPDRVALYGSSSGGCTVLNALAQSPGSFALGIALYPVTDHLKLVEETHRFERYYNEQLIGSLPEDRERYIEFSPITHAEKITDKLVIMHGSKDSVIPLTHTQSFVNKVKEVNSEVEFKVFEGAGHGFRTREERSRFYKLMDAVLDEL